MTLYEKRGRRYYPASEMVAIDALPAGAHLVTVRPGLKTVIYNVDADHACLLAAAEDAKDAMCAAVQAALALEPQRPLTRRQRKIMDEFIAAGGFPMFSRKSAHDIAKAGIDALVQAARAAVEADDAGELPSESKTPLESVRRAIGLNATREEARAALLALADTQIPEKVAMKGFNVADGYECSHDLTCGSVVAGFHAICRALAGEITN